jgi:hypothetical protein
MRPNATHRFGLSIAQWHKFLISLGKISKFRPGCLNVLREIRKTVDDDLAEARWIDDTLGEIPGTAFHPAETGPDPTPPIKGEPVVDSGPDEVVLPYKEAMAFVKRILAPLPVPKLAKPPVFYDPFDEAPDAFVDGP